MAADKLDQLVKLLTDHFAGDEANYRNRDLGAALKKLGSAKATPAKDDTPDTDTASKNG